MMKQGNVRTAHHVTMTLLTKLFAERMAVLYMFFCALFFEKDILLCRALCRDDRMIVRPALRHDMTVHGDILQNMVTKTGQEA